MTIEEEVEAAWRNLVEKDDRTSPAEYPDMALITRDELRAAMEEAASSVRHAGEAVVKPLEWKSNSSNDPESIWTGEIAFGVYYTIETDGHVFQLRRGQFFSEYSDDSMGFWPSSQAARDAAQVDWNANLAPALYASPPDTGLREARALGVEEAAKWHEDEAERIRLLALETDEPRRMHEAQDDHISHAAFLRERATAIRALTNVQQERGGE